jgi:hypothetical protein
MGCPARRGEQEQRRRWSGLSRLLRRFGGRTGNPQDKMVYGYAPGKLHTFFLFFANLKLHTSKLPTKELQWIYGGIALECHNQARHNGQLIFDKIDFFSRVNQISFLL